MAHGPTISVGNNEHRLKTLHVNRPLKLTFHLSHFMIFRRPFSLIDRVLSTVAVVCPAVYRQSFIWTREVMYLVRTYSSMRRFTMIIKYHSHQIQGYSVSGNKFPRISFVYTHHQRDCCLYRLKLVQWNPMVLLPSQKGGGV